jgi:hypothetical protein
LGTWGGRGGNNNQIGPIKAVGQEIKVGSIKAMGRPEFKVRPIKVDREIIKVEPIKLGRATTTKELEAIMELGVGRAIKELKGPIKEEHCEFEDAGINLMIIII